MSATHIVPLRTYYMIFAALIGLTVLTVGIDAVERAGLRAGHKMMPETLHTAISMGIATVKATLVILFFMHLWYSPRLNWVIAGASLLWLVILISYTMTDYVTRTWLRVPGP